MSLCLPTVDPPVPVLGGDEDPARRGTSWRFALLLATTVLAGIFASLVGPVWVMSAFHPLRLTSPDDLAACIPALAASIAVHEFGHLVAASLLGFEVTAISLGPFRISRLHRRWSLQVLWRRLFRGSVTALPHSQFRWRPYMLTVVSAGPIATAAFACIAFCVIVWSGTSTAGGFWEAVLQINTVLFLLGLIPSPARSEEPSDARLFLMLLRYDADARNVLLYHVLMQLRLEGRRPRQYPEWVMRRLAIAEARPAMKAAFALAVAEWALDCGDLASAAAWNDHLGEVTATCDPKLCYTALAQSACLDLVLRNDEAAAAAKLARVPMRLLTPKWLRFRSLAVLDLTRNDIAAALGNLLRAEFYRPAAELPYFEYEQLLIQVLRQAAREMSRSNVMLTPR